MNNAQKNTAIRNGLLLCLMIIVCAILSRCALSGETLSEYEEKQKASSKSVPSAQEQASDSDLQAQEQLHQNQGNHAQVENHSAISGSDQDVDTNSGAFSDTDLATDSSGQASDDAFPSDNAGSDQHIPKSEYEGNTPMTDRITYKEGFYYESLSEQLKNRISGHSYPADDSNALIKYDDLRYVSVLYYNFNGKICAGDIICHQEIAQDLVEIFYELYLAEYPIEKIRLIDEYDANDDLSMADNNSSCFCYRFIFNTNKLSNHSLGKAIDINPFFNPYVTEKNGQTVVLPSGGESYTDRDKPFSYKIDHNDLCYTLFTEHGFEWGGDWSRHKDYQHFEKH